MQQQQHQWCYVFCTLLFSAGCLIELFAAGGAVLVLWGCLPFVLGVVVNVNAFAECLFGWLLLVVLFSSTK